MDGGREGRRREGGRRDGGKREIRSEERKKRAREGGNVSGWVEEKEGGGG